MKKIALEEHFWTEGFPHTGKLAADRIMFPVDYPLEDSMEAALHRRRADQRARATADLLAERSTAAGLG
jgi:hypothetical protein